MNDLEVFKHIKEIADRENLIENPEIDPAYRNVLKRVGPKGNILRLSIGGRGERDIGKIISLLKELKSLTELYIGGKVIEGIEYLNDLKNIKTLELEPDYPIDISIVSQMKHLTGLMLHRIPLSSAEDDAMADISPLSRLTRLKKLTLTLLGLTDVSPLRNLSELTELQMDANNISDISSLSNLKKMKCLKLNLNCIDNISALRGLQNLNWFEAGENEIQDISVLKYLGNIMYLEIERNLIEDISSLKYLKKLGYLDVGNNKIVDISPLEGLNELDEVYLDYNKIKDFSPISHIYFRKYHDIDINKNPSIVPPATIVKKGDAAIVKYFKDMLKAENQMIRKVNKGLLKS